MAKFVAHRIGLPELFPVPDRAMVPIVDAVAIEVSLRNLRPILARIAAGVGVLVECLLAGVSERGAAALLPSRIDAAQRAVNRVAKLVHTDALVIIAVDGQAEQILLTEAGGIAARSSNALVLEGRVRIVSILRHVSIDLVLPNDDEVSVIAHH